MDLRIISVGQLNTLVGDPAFAKLNDIPISPLRAFSQQLNPNADADDPALIIAYDEAGQMMAYFGCLPERLKKQSSQLNLPTYSQAGLADTEKCCWSSCWWVHPTKGQAAAMPVFYKALQVWDAKMLFDALPERSEAVLQKMGYFSFRKISGLHAFLRFKWHKIIPAKIPQLAPLKNVLYVLDTLLNIVVQLRLSFWKRKHQTATGLQISRIAAIDTETEQFIQSLSQKELLHRKRETFNWMIQNPWLSPNETFTKSYYFSSYAEHFDHVLLKIHQDHKMIAFLWLTLRDDTAKLPFCYINPGQEDIVANILLQQLIEFPVDTFICFQQNILPALAKSKAPFLYQKELSKTFGWTKVLDSYFATDFYVQDGDGDSVFT
jgi:hypothetical protein